VNSQTRPLPVRKSLIRATDRLRRRVPRDERRHGAASLLTARLDAAWHAHDEESSVPARNVG